MATTWSYIRPNKDSESPFSAKHWNRHLPLLRPNNSSLVEDLYQLTTDTANGPAAESSREELWVVCNLPFERAYLKLREIQESVTLDSPLGVDCFNLAVRNLVADDADNFRDTKCMGWRHVYQVCKMDSTELTTSRFACDVFGAHLVLIPVVHDGNWSLYAFNMCDRKLSILDSSPYSDSAVRHGEIRRKISGVLNKTLTTPSDGSQNDICSWNCEFPMVPRHQNSSSSCSKTFQSWSSIALEIFESLSAVAKFRNDSGFFVFNFMRLWDGHQLAQSFPEGSRELRKDFLAYMMCFKENEAALPPRVATCISNLSERRKMARNHRQTWAMYPMDSRLLQAATRHSISIQQASENVGQIPMFFRRVTRGIMDCIGARHGGQTVEADTWGIELPAADHDSEIAPPSTANGRVDLVVVPNDVAAHTTAGHDAAATGLDGVAGASSGDAAGEVQQPRRNAAGEVQAETTETQQPTENAALGEGEAETRVAQQSPVNPTGGGREADTWRIQLPAPDRAGSRAIPRLSSMLLRGVTSAGDGVLHIAARHGNLDLVIQICSRAGIRVLQRVQPPPEKRQPPENGLNCIFGICNKLENPENAAHAEFRLLLFRLLLETEKTRETQQNLENAAQDTLPFAEFLRARNHKGETCLHEAVRSGCMEMVHLLMEVDAALDDEATPPLVQVLDDNGVSPLYLAATTSHNSVRALADRHYKYQVSHAGPTGKTALHAAILVSNEERCRVLLGWKSSLATKQDQSGRTPLHYTGSLDIDIGIGMAKLILENDASSGYIADSEGSLPIHAAATMGRLGIIKKLLDVCPNCESTCDAAGRTFLHVAVENGHYNIVKYVCTDPRFRTILNMRDHNGDTALHMALQKGSSIIFCLLYRNNQVSLDSVNKHGRTPLDLTFINNTAMADFKQVRWAWMRNDLLAAGASFGPRERDDHFQSRGRVVISNLDKEKESERLSKSAALLAAVNVLILTTSLQAPFDIADKFHSGEMGSTFSEEKRTKKLGGFIKFDVDLMILSTFSIALFTIAGFPYGSLVLRHRALSFGGFSLWMAFLLFLDFFVERLSLTSPRATVVYVYLLVPVITLFSFLFFFAMTEPFRVVAHVLARLYRLGFRRWHRSLFWCHPAGSLAPFFNVVFVLLSFLVLSLAIGLFWDFS